MCDILWLTFCFVEVGEKKGGINMSHTKFMIFTVNSVGKVIP